MITLKEIILVAALRLLDKNKDRNWELWMRISDLHQFGIHFTSVT